MKPYGIQAKRSGYKLAQLCQAADFHPSTVHYYVKIGLLHKPRKIGLGLYLYDDSHLKKLGEIRTLREKENLSLSKIKERLKSGPDDYLQAVMTSNDEAGRNDSEASRKLQISKQAESTKNRVLDVATELFSRKGYEGTTISDITDALSMSKGSFYLYFRDKRELFIECIERLTYVIVPEETWEDISREEDYSDRQTKRAIGFLEKFPSYAGILNLVKMAAIGEDPSLAQKAKEAFASIVEPIVRDFRRAVAEGAVRDVDAEFFGYAVLGIAENVGYKLMTDPKYDLQECVEKCLDIISRGILPQAVAHPEATEPQRRSGAITDVKGEKVKVREISFGGDPYLVGRFGEGEIRPDMAKVAFIRLQHNGPVCTVEVAMADGETTMLEQDGNLIVSGASSVGLFTIPLQRVRTISLA